MLSLNKRRRQLRGSLTVRWGRGGKWCCWSWCTLSSVLLLSRRLVHQLYLQVPQNNTHYSSVRTIHQSAELKQWHQITGLGICTLALRPTHSLYCTNEKFTCTWLWDTISSANTNQPRVRLLPWLDMLAADKEEQPVSGSSDVGGWFLSGFDSSLAPPCAPTGTVVPAGCTK